MFVRRRFSGRQVLETGGLLVCFVGVVCFGEGVGSSAGEVYRFDGVPTVVSWFFGRGL